MRAAAEAAEAAAREARRSAAAAAAGAAEVKAGIAAAAADAEAADAKARDVLEAAEMEQVALPLKEGGNGEEEGEEEEGATGEGEMETGEEEENDADGTAAPAALRRRRPASRFDFSRLPRALTATATGRPSERERADAELRREQEALVAQLAKGAPNLKAPDQYLQVKERERVLAEELDAARAAATLAAETFSRIRSERHDRFTSAFEHAASAVDEVFKDLTRSDAHPTGGSAYLSLEHADEPYLGGVKFVAMPPAKRYRDMDALSGGEKTLSALALLFAVHSFQAAPFFVLDEVDAALDAANVARVARYVRAKTRASSALAANAPAPAAALRCRRSPTAPRLPCRRSSSRSRTASTTTPTRWWACAGPGHVGRSAHADVRPRQVWRAVKKLERKEEEGGRGGGFFFFLGFSFFLQRPTTTLALFSHLA